MAALSTSDSRCEDTRRAKLTSSREADLLGELGREFDLEIVLQKVPSELHPKVRNHEEGPY